MFDRMTLPYGVFSVAGGRRRIGVAVEDGVLAGEQRQVPSLLVERGSVRRVPEAEDREHRRRGKNHHNRNEQSEAATH